MLWNDPDRWVDADMQRNEWARIGCFLLLAAAVITVMTIMIGVSIAR